MFDTIKKLFFNYKCDATIAVDFSFSDGEIGKIVFESVSYTPLRAAKIASLLSKTSYSVFKDQYNEIVDELYSNGVKKIIIADKQTLTINGDKTQSSDFTQTMIKRKKTRKQSFMFLIPVFLFFISVFSYISFAVCAKEFDIVLLFVGLLLLSHILASFILFRKNDNIVEWGLFTTLLGYFVGLFYLWLLFVDEIYLLNPTADATLYVTIFYPLIPNVFVLVFCFNGEKEQKTINKFKIIMIGAKKYPSRDGGIDAVVSTISEKLAKKGNDVIVYTRRKNEIDNNSKVKAKKVFTINKKATDALIYSFFATLRAVFSNADVIHFHAEGNCYFLWLTKFSKKRIITTIHGLDWQREKFKGLGTKILLKSEKRIVKYSDDIITLSNKDHEYFKNTYGVETIIIPNGFETLTNKDVKIINEKYGLEKEGYLLFLARIVPEKGLHYLIEAYKQTNIKRKLVIAGDAKHASDYYESITKLAEGDERIVFTGFVSGDELNELFSNCYLYILPSDLEGMPISLLEALGHKRVCLVSDIPENHLDDANSYYFEKSSVESLKEMLINIDHKRKSFKENNSLASWDEVVDRTEELYKTKRKIK